MSMNVFFSGGELLMIGFAYPLFSHLRCGELLMIGFAYPLFSHLRCGE